MLIVSTLKRLYARIKPWLPALLVLALSVAAFAALHELTREVRLQDVLLQIRATPSSALLLAALFTVLSYASLAGYDASGLAWLNIKVPLRTLALGSFTGYAVGNTIGMGVLTGGAVRLRVYGSAGLDAGRVARLMAFISAGFGLGITAIGAVGLLWGAHRMQGVLHLPMLVLQAFAVGTLLGIGWVIAACAKGRKLRLLGREVNLPSGRLALIQLLVSALDILFAAAVLWALLPPTELHFMSFLAFYAIGIALGVISHIPAGVGIFEAVILLAYHGSLSTGELAGALILYRVIYYIVPFLSAVGILLVREWRVVAASRARRRAQELSPVFLAGATVFAGVMLLVSGVTPSTEDATDLLRLHVPLVLVESAHFIGSIAGLGMLFVARGILLRLDAAWWAALLLSGVAFVFALPKGIALSEMVVLSTLGLLLISGRREFTRRASLFNQVFSIQWFLMVGAVLGAVTWIMFFVYRDVPYSNELWWKFAFNGHAPRSLRFLLASVVITFAFALWQAFRPASGRAPVASGEDLQRAQAIVLGQSRADAMLALMGDKSLLFSESGKSFVMYGKRGRTWAALYDPIGDAREFSALIWRFLELAHRHGGRACFYQASSRLLPLYVDVGLSPHKLGEYATVPLKDFSTAGPKRAHLRQAISKGERDGLSFEVLSADAVQTVIPALRQVSDAWLSLHATREKGFSLGNFEPAYLARTPVAVVRKDGAVVAFANLMVTDRKSEATIDLMRYTPDAPKGVMDYLFVKLMLHCQEAGYSSFGLGMAPMSGMSQHHNAPRWQRLARLIYVHGGAFYNFQGLRSFKQKYDPLWEPRYLCAEGGIKPLLAFTDIAALISGGIKGVLTK